MKPYLTLALLLLLGACQSTGTASGPNSLTGNPPPDLPANYRAKAAVQLASEYVRDGIGPAEIGSVPVATSGPLGGSAAVTVRYPVRKTRFLGPDSSATRCITVMAYRHVGTGGETKVTVSRLRIDPDRCERREQFEAFTELEQVAAKIRSCKERGEERCPLATNMPEAEARKLISRR